MVFTALSAASHTRTSATWDEPQHLTAGYAALVARDYRIDPEHPPLARLWAASPLLVMRPRAIDTRPIDAITPTDWVSGRLFDFSHRFLYVDNDADRVLYAARFMIVLLGVGLGILVFRWADAWLGFGAAAAAVAAYTLEPNLAAHASLVTSDFGVTCFIFGTAYFLWRTCREPRAVHVAGLVAFFVAAQLTKYSAIVLAPVVVVTLTFAVVRMRTLRASAAVAIVLTLAAATVAGIWTVYGFRYAPSATTGWLFAFHRDPVVIQRLPNLAATIGWIDTHHLLPNAYSQGFLLGQAKAQVRDSFLAGQFSDRGLRHLLPIYPFAILIAAAATRELVARRQGRVALAVLAA